MQGSQLMLHENKGRWNVNDDKEKAYHQIIDTLSSLKENHLTYSATLIVRDTVCCSILNDVNNFVPSLTFQRISAATSKSATWAVGSLLRWTH